MLNSLPPKSHMWDSAGGVWRVTQNPHLLGLLAMVEVFGAFQDLFLLSMVCPGDVSMRFCQKRLGMFNSAVAMGRGCGQLLTAPWECQGDQPTAGHRGSPR